MTHPHAPESVSIGPLQLPGTLIVPPQARGLVVFAHGSGSSRLSPRNQFVAQRLQREGLATLLFDLLTPEESQDRERVFDIPLLGRRLGEAMAWCDARTELRRLPMGLFGASTGAAAALVAAGQHRERVTAVVSRGGRPDLAGRQLLHVQAPTLLIVGGDDHEVLALNRQALQALGTHGHLAVVPGASHLFEEPGTLEQAADLAARWFSDQWPRHEDRVALPLHDRHSAGRLLGERLRALVLPTPVVVLALPRGGVPVAVEVALALHAPLDLLLVRKIGAPWNPEFAAAAVVEGEPPDLVVNEEATGVDTAHLQHGLQEAVREIARRRQVYLAGRSPRSLTGATVVVVDDGIATGTTLRAALMALRRRHPARLVLAVPVAPADTLAALRPQVDRIVCLATPEPFEAIGLHYRDFHQLSDDEVRTELARVH